MESSELQDNNFFTNSDSPKPQSHDEHEYVAELTRQMTNYMLQDDEKHQKSWGGSCSGSGSPQSTLWSPFASGYSSPIGPSREPSPPLTTVEKSETKPVLIPFKSKQALIDDQIRSVQANFQKMKKEENQRNGAVLHKGTSTVPKQYGGVTGVGYNQQRTGSGMMKAVFLDGLGSKTGSGGTGVFLPRGHGTVVESRKKSGCSTVIIPARVVEALKDHFDKLGVPSTFSSDIPPFHDALLVSMKSKNNKNNKSNSSSKAQSGPPYTVEVSAENHREPPPDLPQEWTY